MNIFNLYQNYIIPKQKKLLQLNATIVGSLNISDDFIVSGFSGNNYLLLDTTRVPTINWGDTFEFQLKYICTQFISTGCYLISQTMGLKERQQYYQYWKDNSFNAGNISIQHEANVWCYINIYQECNQTGQSKIIFSYSTDKINWTTVTKNITYSSGALIPTFIGMALGGSSSEYFRGSIDMKECYLKINDSTVWKGVI